MFIDCSLFLESEEESWIKDVLLGLPAVMPATEDTDWARAGGLALPPPRYRPGTGEFIRGQTGPWCPPARAAGAAGTRTRAHRGRAGEKGPGMQIAGGRPRRAGRGEPRTSGGAPVPAGGAWPPPPHRGELRGAGPAGGAGAEPHAAAGRAGPRPRLFVNKRSGATRTKAAGRAISPRSAPLRAPLRTAQPRSLGGPASPLDQVLQLALRRETGRGALAAGRGGGGAAGGGGSHLAEPLAEDALGGEDLLSHAAQLLHGPGPAHTHTQGEPPGAPPPPAARAPAPPSLRAPRHNAACAPPAGGGGGGAGERRRGAPQIPR